MKVKEIMTEIISMTTDIISDKEKSETFIKIQIHLESQQTKIDNFEDTIKQLNKEHSDETRLLEEKNKQLELKLEKVKSALSGEIQKTITDTQAFMDKKQSDEIKNLKAWIKNVYGFAKRGLESDKLNMKNGMFNMIMEYNPKHSDQDLFDNVNEEKIPKTFEFKDEDIYEMRALGHAVYNQGVIELMKRSPGDGDASCESRIEVLIPELYAILELFFTNTDEYKKGYPLKRYSEKELIDAFLKVYIAPDTSEEGSLHETFKRILDKDDPNRIIQALSILLRVGFEDTFKELTGKTIRVKDDCRYTIDEGDS